MAPAPFLLPTHPHLTQSARPKTAPSFKKDAMMKTVMMTAGLMLMSAAGVAADEWKPRFALQLYSFRDRSFTDAVKSAKKLGFEYVEAYPGQALGGDLKGTTAFA